MKPTVLVGCSTNSGAFTEEVVKEIAKGTERPIIFPLLNPNRLAEADPKDANGWADGKALLATGSPFPPCRVPSGKAYIVAECNSKYQNIPFSKRNHNQRTAADALVYPGIVFGTIVSQSGTLTDSMIVAAARCLASLSAALKDPEDGLLPDFGNSLTTNLEIAIAVVEQAIEEGQAGIRCQKEDVRRIVTEAQWKPFHKEYVYDADGET